MPVSIPIIALIFALLAAAIHVYIFTLESLLWTKPATRATFGVRSEKVAETLRPMAYNQGFYNLFLALGVIIGWLLTLSPVATVAQTGIGMLLLALASMAGAALVQGIAPGIALLALFLA